MEEDLGLLLYEGQVRAAEETVDAWLTNHRNAMKATSVEGLVPLILELAEFPSRAVALVRLRLESEEVESCDAAGERLRNIFDTTLRLLEGVGKLVQAEQARGYEIKGAEKVHGALVDLRRQRDAEMQNWPSQDEAKNAKPQSARDVLMKFAGCMTGLPADMARNHDHYIHGTPKR